MYRYKKSWRIEHNPKPIPDRRHDWEWWHEDAEEMCGTGESLADCIRQIEEMEEE